MKKIIAIILLLIVISSCQKQTDFVHKNEIDLAATSFNPDKFFQSSQNKYPAVKRVVDYLKKENSKKEFLPGFAKAAGYPRWDKALLKAASKINNYGLVYNEFQENDSICIIPLVSQNNTAITGILIAELLDNEIKCHYSLVNDYADMGESKRRFVLGMIQLEKFVFGHTTFRIIDHSLLGSSNAILLRSGSGQFHSVQNQINNFVDEPCIIVEIWFDPTGEDCHCTGDETYTGEWYYEGDCFGLATIPYILPLGGGGSYSLPSNSSGGGGSGGPNNPPPYISTFVERLNFLQSQLDMSPESNDFLSGSESTVNEMYNYLYANSTDERKENASNHIQKMAIDPGYAIYVSGYRTYSGNSNTPWWENQTWLDDPANFHLDITQANNQYDKLTAAEKILVGIYPLQAYIIKQNINVAMSASASSGLSDPLNGKQDAFRHAFFQAINTRDVPPAFFGGSASTATQIVSLFALAHESEVPIELSLEKQMDIFNNNVGIAYCWNCWTTSNSSIADAIMNKINSGELKYLSPLDLSQSPHWPTGLNGILPSTTLKWTNQ